MRLGIDFATKDFFCAGHCQLDYVLTQRLAKPRRILLKLDLCGRHNFIRLDARLLLGVLDDSFRAPLGIGDDFRGLVLTFAKGIRRTFGCQIKALSATLGGGQPFGARRAAFRRQPGVQAVPVVHRRMQQGNPGVEALLEARQGLGAEVDLGDQHQVEPVHEHRGHLHRVRPRIRDQRDAFQVGSHLHRGQQPRLHAMLLGGLMTTLDASAYFRDPRLWRFITGTLSYDTSNDVFLKKSRLWLDYAHNFTKWGDDAQNKAYEKLTGYGFKSKYQGTGARDVVALTWEGSEGDFSLMTEVMAGFNVIGMKAGAENVFGVTIMPSYKFTPNWEGVVRYQMAAGSNAVKWEKRYTQNSTYSGTSDCMQALYLGVNYYIFECNPNMAKIMAGVEYAHSNGTDASRQKGFTGWSYNIAFRTNF